jgi:hypothetical protein
LFNFSELTFPEKSVKQSADKSESVVEEGAQKKKGKEKAAEEKSLDSEKNEEEEREEEKSRDKRVAEKGGEEETWESGGDREDNSDRHITEFYQWACNPFKDKKNNCASVDLPQLWYVHFFVSAYFISPLSGKKSFCSSFTRSLRVRWKMVSFFCVLI